MTPIQQAPRRGAVRLLVPMVVLGWVLGCGFLEDMTGGGGDEELVAPAEALLQQGDLPGAASKYEELVAAHPESVEAHEGLAYTRLLAGDYGAADAALQQAEGLTEDPTRLGEIKLRRAIVALRMHDLDAVKEHGSASGLPEGRLLAAEVHLVDLRSEEAMTILRELKGEGGAVGETASTYLAMLETTDQIQAGLAEATALWALGERESACEAAEDLVKALPPDEPGKDAQLLLWAGRAVTSGLPGTARSLLDEIAFPPEGQQWRLNATRAMVLLVEGDSEGAMEIFDALRAGAEGGDLPRDGVNDALATACSLTEDVEVAKALVEGVESAGAARCLLDAGAVGEAKSRAPEGTLKAFLENK